jgi:hypothetical protein
MKMGIILKWWNVLELNSSDDCAKLLIIKTNELYTTKEWVYGMLEGALFSHSLRC